MLARIGRATSARSACIVRTFASAPAPPADIGAYERQIFETLAAKLDPTKLVVKDVSGGCGSMFAIQIASSQFKGMPMVKQHRLVNEILGDEIPKWHGLQLRTSVPKDN